MLEDLDRWKTCVCRDVQNEANAVSTKKLGLRVEQGYSIRKVVIDVF